MSFFDEAPSLEKVRGLVLSEIGSITKIEAVPITEACGRVLAREFKSRIPFPLFDRALRDGYAVWAADTAGASEKAPKTLELIGHVYAGHGQYEFLQSAMKKIVEMRRGECIQIATGAPMPAGADAVIELERTKKENKAITLFERVASGTNVSRRGSEFKKGAVLIKKNTMLTPEKIHALASSGATRVSVYRQPRVAIVPTGSELAELGNELRQGEIYNSNAYFLSELVRANGGSPLRQPIVQDNVKSMVAAIKKAHGADLIVFSGSSSVGERDLVETIIKKYGTMLFHGVRMRPGRSLLAGKIDKTLVIGLPGNPAACVLCAHLLLKPALGALARRPDMQTKVSARLAKDVKNKSGVNKFIFVRLAKKEAVPLLGSMAESIAHADGYAEIPEGAFALKKGKEIDVILF
jgi:molybdenum cofactor synthesis domain-containing protein